MAKEESSCKIEFFLDEKGILRTKAIGGCSQVMINAMLEREENLSKEYHRQWHKLHEVGHIPTDLEWQAIERLERLMKEANVFRRIIQDSATLPAPSWDYEMEKVKEKIKESELEM